MPKGTRTVQMNEPSDDRIKRLRAKIKELELQKRLLDLEIEKCKIEIEYAEQEGN